MSNLETLDPAIARLLKGEAVSYPSLARTYPQDFAVDPSYKDDLPDLQNGPESLIKGARRAIQHVAHKLMIARQRDAHRCCTGKEDQPHPLPGAPSSTR